MHNLEADLIPDLGCSDRKSTLTSLKTAILGTAVSCCLLHWLSLADLRFLGAD